MRKPYILFFLFLTVFISCKPQTGNRPVEPVVEPPPEENEYQAQIDSSRKIIIRLMRENKTPGMAVAVSVNGKMIWSEGFGYTDRENQAPVDPSKTLFRIGSVSKTLTASALGILMDEGKVNEDLIVQTYVSYFPAKRYPITVKQVAGHIAGVRHYRENEMLSDKPYMTVREGLGIFENDSLLFSPGTDYSYSSYGWNLISAVVEGAGDQDFLLYMQSNVFDPLKMVNTMADEARKNIPNRTKFYVVEEGEVKDAPYVDNSYKWAGGGFISTVEDLIRFGNAHIEPGFLTEETLNRLQTSLKLDNGEETNYGMGWRMGRDDQDKYFVGHTGGSVGGITRFWIYPYEKVVIAILSNASPLDYNDADRKMAWLFMDEDSL